MLDVTPVTFESGKSFSLIDDMMKCWRQYEKIYNSGQNICKMWQNQTNFNNTRKAWYLLLSNFWLILPKTNAKEWILDSRLCPHQISKILSLELYSILWDSSHAKILMLDIKTQFAWVESNFYCNTWYQDCLDETS